MHMKIILTLILSLSSSSIHAGSDICAPENMLKVVTSAEIPGAPKDGFASMPKINYRFSNRYGRTEEEYNPATGLHILAVVDEPNMWIANRATGKGRHIIDPGPSFNFRATLFGDEAATSLFIRSLEIGCEVDAFEKSNIKPIEIDHLVYGIVSSYVYIEGNESIKLLTKKRKPVRLEYYKDGVLDVAQNYLEYKDDLDFDPNLFLKPSNIIFNSTN